jgi:hypothetical protein
LQGLKCKTSDDIYIDNYTKWEHGQPANEAFSELIMRYAITDGTDMQDVGDRQ